MLPQAVEVCATFDGERQRHVPLDAINECATVGVVAAG